MMTAREKKRGEEETQRVEICDRAYEADADMASDVYPHLIHPCSRRGWLVQSVKGGLARK
jgi:hypothetical protein